MFDNGRGNGCLSLDLIFEGLMGENEFFVFKLVILEVCKKKKLEGWEMDKKSNEENGLSGFRCMNCGE